MLALNQPKVVTTATASAIATATVSVAALAVAAAAAEALRVAVVVLLAAAAGSRRRSPEVGMPDGRADLVGRKGSVVEIEMAQELPPMAVRGGGDSGGLGAEYDYWKVDMPELIMRRYPSGEHSAARMTGFETCAPELG